MVALLWRNAQQLGLTESLVRKPGVGAIPAEFLPRIKELQRIPASASLKTMMEKAMPLDPSAIVVSEASFRKLLLQKRHRGVPATVRHTGAIVAAALSDSAALGVFAKLRSESTDVRSNLFVVLRDAVILADGDVEGRDAYVAVVELSGSVDWVRTCLGLLFWLALQAATSKQEAAGHYLAADRTTCSHTRSHPRTMRWQVSRQKRF